MNSKNPLFFIKHSFFFLVGLLILIFIIDIGVKYTVKRIKVGEYGILNKINYGEINAEVLISGSSRALKAINPQIITKETGMSCFNIASDGSDLGVQIPKLKWYCNRNKKPKILVQDVSQFGGGISSTIYEPFKYLPYLSDDSLYNGLLRIDGNFWLHKYLYPSNLFYFNFDFYSKMFQDLFHTIKNNDQFINGFLPDDSKWSSDFDHYKNQNPNGINCSITNDYSLYLEELIYFCKNNKIVLVLVVLPNYYRLNEITENSESIFTYYEQLEETPFIYYLNYSNISIASDEENFYNFTHLNSNGAKRFSEIFSHDLLNYLKIPKR